MTTQTSINSKMQPRPNYAKITPEREIALKQVWANLLHLWGVPLDASEAYSDRRLSAYSSHTSAVSEKDTKEKKKGGWFGFGGGSSKSEGDGKPGAPLEATTSTDPDQVYKYEKGVVHPALQGMDGKLVEQEFWDMLRVDPPDSMVWRFSSARKFDSHKATKMIARTFKFRTKRNLKEVLNLGEKDVFAKKEEGVMLNFKQQKAVIVGRDLKDRPFILVRPKFHHAGDQKEEDIEKFALIVIEIVRLHMRTGYTSIIFDLTDFGLSNMDYAPVKFLISCFEAHFPESLGCLLIHHAPWLFSPIWNIVKNWLDPVVASKIIFTKNLDELTRYVSKEAVPKYLGGENDFDLDNYVAPDGSHDEKLKDTEARDALLEIRAGLIAKFKELTVQWIETSDSDKSTELWEQRIAIGQEITNNYCELDQYIRSRSYYDINGSLQL